MGDLVDLKASPPSVESVIERLGWHKDKIKHISVVIEWDNETLDVCGDQKCSSEWLLHTALLEDYAKSFLRRD